MTISSSEIKRFQSKILSWYSEHKRDLPWRKTRDPYKILVSEIMLQQTQVSRVIPKYEAWLKAFSMTEALAKAKVSDVLRLWSGLGYNRRALYLQKTAQTVWFDYSNNWPKTVEELKKLPGIGEYTARAVACFAFDQQVAVVDTNVKKIILLEFFCHCEKPKATKQSHDEGRDCFASLAMTEKDIQMIADQLLPKHKAYDWNQALMDYASAVLKKEKIPIPKQSKFKDSNRYYRGKLLRLLLQKNSLSASRVGSYLKDDFSTQDTQWLSNLLTGMEKDGFISRKGKKITLKT